MPDDAFEFTHRFGVTHTRGCDTCACYKNHIIIAKVTEGVDSYAWEARDKFEADLISLGRSAALAQRDASGPSTLSDLNQTLERENHRLITKMEALQRSEHCANKKIKSLEDWLDLERLDLESRNYEIKVLRSKNEEIIQRYIELEHKYNIADTKVQEYEAQDRSQSTRPTDPSLGPVDNARKHICAQQKKDNIEIVLDDSDLEYIRAMNENETGAASAPVELNNMEWILR